MYVKLLVCSRAVFIVLIQPFNKNTPKQQQQNKAKYFPPILSVRCAAGWVLPWAVEAGGPNRPPTLLFQQTREEPVVCRLQVVTL
jgi:hypothetical protein